MNNLDTIKNDLLEKIKNTDAAPEDLEKWSATLKNLTDSEKSEVQNKNEKESIKNENKRFYISIATTLIAAGGLFWAIINQTIQERIQAKQFDISNRFQAEQFKATAQLQVQSSEDNQWREFITKLADDSNISNDISLPVLLKSFMSSKKYATQAHDIATLILARTSNLKLFKLLFRYTDFSTTWKNCGDLVFITKSLDSISSYLKNNPKGKIEPAHDEKICNINEELSIISASITRTIRANKNPHNPDSFNISGVRFVQSNLSNVDFSSSDMRNTIFDSCNFKNAILDITLFNSAKFDRSNWWQAKSIDTRLLGYLINKFPFDARKDPDDSIAFAKWKNKLNHQ
jgi:hypothetical protein